MNFEKLKKFAAENGWYVEKIGRKYHYWKVDENGVGPTDGTEYESTTIKEAYGQIYWSVK